MKLYFLLFTLTQMSITGCEKKNDSPAVPISANHCLTETWAPVPNPVLKTGNTHKTIFFEKTGKLILVNGGPESGIPAAAKTQLFEWTVQGWILVSEDGPERRNWFDACYDRKRQVLVFYGGHRGTGQSYTETWEWNGAQWAHYPAPGPGEREGALMCYDEALERTILFGGFQENTVKGDTWSWDGAQWNLMASSGPAPRSPGGLFYDPVSRKTWLLGGHSVDPNSFAFFKDLWRLDDSGWTLVAESTGTGYQYQGAFAFVPECGSIVLAGGSGGQDAENPAFHNNMWRWTGHDFEPLTATCPSARSGASFAYFPPRKTLVFHGGFSAPGGMPGNDTWEMAVGE